MMNKSFLTFVIIAFIVFNLNLRDLSSGDTIANKYLPFSLFRDGDFDLSEYEREIYEYGHGVLRINDRLLPGFPPSMGVLSLPIYLPFYVFGFDSVLFVHLASKISASLMAALSVGFMYLLLSSVFSNVVSRIFTFSYAFGTCVFSVASQDIYQHSGSLLFLSIGVYTLFNHGKIRYSNVILGLSWGLAVFSRYPVLIMMPFLFILSYHRMKREVFASIVIFILILSASVLLNIFVYDSFLGAYSKNMGRSKWNASLESYLGLLFSPSRGLFLYSSFLLLGIVGFWYSVREKDVTNIFLGVSAFSYFVFIGLFHHWWAGHSFGPRLLCETLPFLVLLSAFGYQKINSNFRNIVFLLILFSLIIHFIGAFSYDGSWNTGDGLLCDVDKCPDRLWRVGDSQIVYYVSNPRIHIFKYQIG